jgi:hypothetical protein
MMFEKPFSKNSMTKRNKFAAMLAFILILTLPPMIVSIPMASAANYDSYAFLALSTNPIGVTQNEIIVVWLALPPPTASGPAGERWQNFTVTITRPDGITETKGPYSSDAIGQGYFSYVPTQVGTYQVQFSFPGQLSQNGNYYNPATSPKASLIVQQNPVQQFPDTPLPGPNDYWQRPISGENILWTPFSGNWLALGSSAFGARAFDPSAGNVNTLTVGPRTAHVVWTKPNAFGGVIGGNYSAPPTYYTGNSYEDQFCPPVIINGVLYYNTANPPRYGFQAVDLRTGRTLWYQNSTGQPTPQTDSATLGGIYWPGITNGQVLNYVTENQFGGIPYLWQTAGSLWSMYDAFTGNWILNLANATGGSGGASFLTDNSGTLFTYLLGSSWIAMWNSSKAVPMSTTIAGYRTWRPLAGSTTDWRNGIQWNVTVPTIPGQSIAKIGSGVIIAASASGAAPGTRTEIGYDAATGKQLWVQNRTHLIPGSNNFNLQGPIDSGIYTEFIKEKASWYGFSTQTGAQLWGPTEPTPNGWSIYNTGSNIAYGTLYALSLDGLHAYNLTTGKHLWDYSPGSSGFEAIYGVWPFDLGSFSIAGGIVYIASGHSHGILPQFRGARMYGVNATDGTLVFSILGWMQDGWTNSPAIADGYLVTENGYDNQIYCLGKGQTATTVTYSPVIGSSTKVLIKGSVTDQSPGQTCLGIPAAGTPAISDASMSAWTEYLYEQQPKPTNATGVSILLTAIDPNGNLQTIGTVTSDIDGNFATIWTPPVPGIYTIKASFDGSGSYFKSYGTVSFGIANAPAASAAITPTPTPTAPTSTIAPTVSPIVTPTPTTPQGPGGIAASTIYAIAAAAIVIVIVAVAAVALRKRK